jgi:O-antigen/teichoic acid export membrane protein
MMLITVGLTFGVPDVITYFYAKRSPSSRAVMRKALGWTALAGILVTAAVIYGGPVVLTHHNRRLDEVLTDAAFAITPTLLLGIVRARAAGLGRWNRISAERSVGALAELCGLVAAVAVGKLSPMSAVLIISLSPIGGSLCYIQRRADGSSATCDRTLELPLVVLTSPFSFAMRVWFGAVFGVMLMRLDQVLMIPLSTPTQLGLYAVAVSVSEVPLVITSAVRDVLFVRDAQCAESTEVQRLARFAALVVFLVAAFLDVVVIVGARLLLGAGFQHIALPLILLSVAVVAGAPGTAAGAGLSARGRPGARSAILIGASILNAGMIVLLVPRFGATGASIATIVGNTVASSTAVWMFSRRYGVRPRDFYGIRGADIGMFLRLPLARSNV